MKKLISAALALTVVAGAGAAAAQPFGYGGYQGQRGGYEARYDRGGYDTRYYDNRNDRRGGYQRFQRGQRLPSAYRGNRYVVNDWRARRLHQPPRGYHWVNTGNNDYVLAAIATGLIASIISGGF